MELGGVQGTVVVGMGTRKWCGFLLPGRTLREPGNHEMSPLCFATGDQRSREGNALAQSHAASLCQCLDLNPEPFRECRVP